jgi:uncharacterized spore protein YtfJ
MPRKKARRGSPDLRELRNGRLSYGRPVSVDGRTVIPVTRVRVQRLGDGGGGGAIESAPVGYIEVTADGSAFVPIEDDRRALRAAAAVATTLVGAIAGARALRATRRPPRLLPPGRLR